MSTKPINPHDAIYQPYYKRGWTFKEERRNGYTAILFFDENGLQRCGAKKVKKDEICEQWVLKENGRCRKHGGDSLKGAAHPAFKGNSRYAPFVRNAALAERLEAFVADEQLMDLRHNAALTEARIAQLLETLGDGELAGAWVRLRDLISDAQKALRAQQMDSFALYWLEIRRIVNEGAQQYLVWAELMSLNERKRKLVETSEKISLMGERSISVADHLATVATITQVFLSHIKDEQTRRKVIAEIQRVSA